MPYLVVFALPVRLLPTPGARLRAAWAGLLLALLALVPAVAQAQRAAPVGRDWRDAATVAAAVSAVDIGYTGGGAPSFRYDYSGPVFGITYAQAGFLAGLAYGPENNAVADTLRTRYFSIAVNTVRAIPLVPRDASAQRRLFIPAGLLAEFRRVTRTNPARAGFSDDLGVTTIILGAGAGADALMGANTAVQARLMPGLGVASRDIGNSTGLAWLADAGVLLTHGPVAGRFGVSAGYDFRYTGWRLGPPFRGEGLARDALSYRTVQHGVRIGVAF